MPVPELEAWRARWDTSDGRRMGVRPVTVHEGGAEIAVDLPYGDERDEDPLFAVSALTYVADITALSAVLAYLGEHDRPNGTASLHLDYITEPASTVTVEGRVVAQNHMEAIVDLAGREADGRLALRGVATFSVRPGSAADV